MKDVPIKMKLSRCNRIVEKEIDDNNREQFHEHELHAVKAIFCCICT